ncbi:MAG: MBL fold metallo-hydrolase [Gammaproteobacteria bacterium]|nr:MBL fold metallo-hydrolase [Pseudomonadales bacterium]
MKVRMWGVRGSIPAPGRHTQEFGGNTTCIEVRTDSGQLIILDAGTGIFPLAQSLLPSLPIKASLFITHTHWDHIQGLPFFTPLFIPGNHLSIHGAQDVVSGQGIEQAMETQMQYSYFPVREAELRAALNYHTVKTGAPVKVGDATVTGTILNHPVVNMGYRIDCNGKSVFFTGDHEPYSNIYEPDDDEYRDYQRVVDERQQQVDAAMKNVDVLIADCSYTREEFQTKIGWGHGSFDHSIAMADRVGAGTLICTHHEPTRSDLDLKQVFDEAVARHPRTQDKANVILAYEGLELEF